MAKETESNNKSLAEDSSVDLESCKEGAVASRRRFTRQAIMGSAVLFSLGNRPAWGQAECISDNLWLSLGGETPMMVSHHGELNAGDYTLEVNGDHCINPGGGP
jgi:hypothetical protein